jgi:predicted lipid-binding transport protein (Tim44 family)
VVPAKGQDPIQIVQRKCKDAELTAPAYARLEQVPIAGWTDEDGQPVGSAVAVEADAPVERPKIDHKLAGHRQMFKDAWLKRGAEDRDGLPYLSRAALVDYLIEERKLKQSSADQVAKGSVPGKMTTVLAEAGVITIEKDGEKTTGYLVIDSAQAAAMMIARKEDQEGRT